MLWTCNTNNIIYIYIYIFQFLYYYTIVITSLPNQHKKYYIYICLRFDISYLPWESYDMKNTFERQIPIFFIFFKEEYFSIFNCTILVNFLFVLI